MYTPLEAFLWGIASAISLPLGVIIGFIKQPGPRIRATLMAFGAGALLFALSIELFGEALFEEHDDASQVYIVGAVLAVAAIGGGILFELINWQLNQRGAFLRGLSTRINHVKQLRYKLYRRLLRNLRKIHIFQDLPQDELLLLIPYMQKARFRKNEVIFFDSDAHTPLYFILRGKVRVEVEDASITQEFNYSEYECFGEMEMITGIACRAMATALVNTSVLKLKRQDFDRVVQKSEHLRNHLNKKLKEGRFGRIASSTMELKDLATPSYNTSFPTDTSNYNDNDDYDESDNNSNNNNSNNNINNSSEKDEYQNNKIENNRPEEIRITVTRDVQDQENEKPTTPLSPDINEDNDASYIESDNFDVNNNNNGNNSTINNDNNYNNISSEFSSFEENDQNSISPEEREQRQKQAIEQLQVVGHEEEEEGHKLGNKSVAIAIWLGILIDGIPESLVIGMTTQQTGVSLALILGVFLANLPESLSSSVTMRQHKMSRARIFVMWTSITVFTALGAFLGAVIFSGDLDGFPYYAMKVIKGIAGGAMLVVIAKTMLPEAFEQGGDVVGIATLLGFLAALAVKVAWH